MPQAWIESALSALNTRAQLDFHDIGGVLFRLRQRTAADTTKLQWINLKRRTATRFAEAKTAKTVSTSSLA